MSASEKIKQRREELGLTQDELAKKLGYKSRSSINKIETSRDLPIKKIREFAKVLDCSPSYLMGWDCETDIILTDNEKQLIVELRNSDKETVKMIERILAYGKLYEDRESK